MTSLLNWILPRNVIELFARLGRVFFVPYGTVRNRQNAAEHACLEWLSENVDEILSLRKAELTSRVGGRVVYVYVGSFSPMDPNFYRYTFWVKLPRFTFTSARVEMRIREVFPPV